MIEVAHHQGIDRFQFRQEQRKQAQRMHGAQRLGGMRLGQDFTQVQPQLRSSRRRGCQGWQHALNLVFRGRAQPHVMMGDEMEKPEQDLGILQGGRLTQENQAIDHGKVGVGDSRPQVVKVARKRGPGRRDFVQQLGCGAMNRAGVAEINPHPVGGRESLRIVHSDPEFGGFFLCLPGQKVVVSTGAKVQEAPH